MRASFIFNTLCTGQRPVSPEAILWPRRLRATTESHDYLQTDAPAAPLLASISVHPSPIRWVNLPSPVAPPAASVSADRAARAGSRRAIVLCTGDTVFETARARLPIRRSGPVSSPQLHPPPAQPRQDRA